MKIKFSVENLLLFLLSLPTIIFIVTVFSYSFLVLIFCVLFLHLMSGGSWVASIIGLISLSVLFFIAFYQLRVVRQIVIEKKVLSAFKIIPVLLLSGLVYAFTMVFLPRLNFDFAGRCGSLEGQEFKIENINKLNGFCGSVTEAFKYEDCNETIVNDSISQIDYVNIWTYKKDTPQLFCTLQRNPDDTIKASLGSYFD